MRRESDSSKLSHADVGKKTPTPRWSAKELSREGRSAAMDVWPLLDTGDLALSDPMTIDTKNQAATRDPMPYPKSKYAESIPPS